MAKFRKKPVVIEAVQYDGSNDAEIIAFTKKKAIKAFDKNVMIIPTLEGDHIASAGDWIIKGVAGEFYPCKNEIFLKTYDEVND